MASKNAIRVDRFRKSKGYVDLKNKYHKLRFKYGISVNQANIMKFWGLYKILLYIEENNLEPTEEYLSTLKDIERI